MGVLFPSLCEIHPDMQLAQSSPPLGSSCGGAYNSSIEVGKGNVKAGDHVLW